LAETLGCTKAELMNRISSKELLEWTMEFKLRAKEEKEKQKAQKAANKKGRH
jgi:hypothetical protein